MEYDLNGKSERASVLDDDELSVESLAVQFENSFSVKNLARG